MEQSKPKKQTNIFTEPTSRKAQEMNPLVFCMHPEFAISAAIDLLLKTGRAALN